MSKEKNNKVDFEDVNILTNLMDALATPSTFSLFGGMVKQKEKYPYERLGNGFELRPLDIEDNRNNYSHLYKDGKQVNSLIFRKGGTCHGFKDGYCRLILYAKQRKTKGNLSGFNFGSDVIINELGEVKMESKGLNYPYHLGGNVASLDHVYYNLLTGEAIMPKSSETINAKNFLIVEHRYDFDCYSKEVKLPVGVYTINKETCEVTLIDEIK
jgi:hypothetical protein